MLRRTLLALAVVLVCTVLLALGLVALALAGRPGPLARVIGVALDQLPRLTEVRDPIPADVDTERHDPARPVITHGVASGDVTDTRAVIWVRASGPSVIRVEYAANAEFSAPRVVTGSVDPDADFTGRVELRDLLPDTAYHYRVLLVPLAGEATADDLAVQQGIFRTAPPRDGETEVRFVFGGDLGGGGYCRREAEGYRIFEAMRQLAPTFFLALGDMIYADDPCPRRRPDGGMNVPGAFRPVTHPAVDWRDVAGLRATYWAHWRYNRADLWLQGLLASAPVYATWDDHEVINDFGGAWSHWRAGTKGRVGYQNLVAVGREALFAYMPIARAPDDPDRLYRSFRWGRDLELFLLDVRSYRSRNDERDSAERPKTMLGAKQRAWLTQRLVESTATWKIVASTVPLSAPTGGVAVPLFGRDGWARGSGPDPWSRTGFERELVDLIRHLDAARVQNVVFVGADLHQALAVRYETDLDGDGTSLVFHEFIVGPLSATPRREAPPLDPRLSPTLLFSEGGVHNFGAITVARGDDGRAQLTFEVRGVDGAVRPGSTVRLTARE